MGLFLSMSCVLGADGGAVADALRAFAAERGGALTSEQTRSEDEDVVISQCGSGTSAVFPRFFMMWDEVSTFLSAKLNSSVFSFHIHDGDFWMYQLFSRGLLADRFSPMPDYWGETDEAEAESWQGDAAAVAAAVPGLMPERVSPYLVRWDDALLERGGKAFPEDEFDYGRDWQLIDFMKKLGFGYPFGDQGEPLGPTYRLYIPPQR